MSNNDNVLIVSGAPADVKDVATYVLCDKELDFTFKDLIRHDALLKSLADKKTRDFNLGNIWEKNLRKLLMDSFRPSKIDSNEALRIAENDDASPLGVTSLTVRPNSNEEKNPSTIHILVNREFGRTLIVGDTPSKSIKDAFNKAHIIYVDRSSKTALAEIKAALTDVVGNQKMERAREALLYRAADNGQLKKPLPELLVETKETSYPKYVVKR